MKIDEEVLDRKLAPLFDPENVEHLDKFVVITIETVDYESINALRTKPPLPMWTVFGTIDGEIERFADHLRAESPQRAEALVRQDRLKYGQRVIIAATIEGEHYDHDAEDDHAN